ncbi:chemotaxis protein CheW [Chitinivorax sp. PXF-14]|uniref:chemotaxis protein CheW n=1 Tax=Chitinivorax sp. PXF-14 TaxID=3230488 RepID=UPI0034668BAE
MSQLATQNGRAVKAKEQVQTRQYLTFTLGAELFAIQIEHIREIIEFGGLTEIPLMPAFLRGVINLRGAVVPVIDLSIRFGRSETQIARRTCIVILEVAQEEEMQPLGVIVDAVNEVLTLDSSEMEPRPSFGAKIRADFIEGMFSRNDRFVITLDIHQVLSVDEMSALIGLTHGEETAD